MNEVCSKNFINWLKYDNHRNTNKIQKSEERTILRKWIKIKVDLFYYSNNLKVIHFSKII